MGNFMSSNWPTVLLLLALLGVTLYLIINKKWNQLRKFAYDLFLQAEWALGTKAGKEKFELVFKQIYNMLPPWVRFFISEDTARAKLQAWFNDIKSLLDDDSVCKSKGSDA